MAKQKPAPALEPAAAPAAKSLAPAVTKARVLVTGPFGAINTVVELDEITLRQGVACGQIDPHPDAVAYAESLKG